jgi:hypothetical protein
MVEIKENLRDIQLQVPQKYCSKTLIQLYYIELGNYIDSP